MSAWIHKELRRLYPKTGRCEECGETYKRTSWSYQRHPWPHTLRREDYREACYSCHYKLDALRRRLQAQFGVHYL